MIRGKNLLTAVSILFTALVLYTCAGSAPVNQGTPVSQETSSTRQPAVNQQQSVMPETVQTNETAQYVPAPVQTVTPASRYYSGDGGGGIRLAVLVPGSSGLGAEQNYLPTLVQGVLVGDLSKYSAMSVLDRMRLETVLRETESGIYRNEADYGQLGEIANVDYALTGSITRTNTGYAMQIQVVGTGSENIGVTRASYSGSCTIAEFDNFTGIRKASLELLTQMGVNLTETARQELNAAAQANNVSAQTALAQGIIAQRSGHTFESLALFYEAGDYDSSIAEAVSRASTLSSTIRTGSWIENIRNDITWRNEWRNIIQEYYNFADTWYRNNPKPDFYPTELVYDPELRVDTINYRNDTMVLRYTAQIIRNDYPEINRNHPIYKIGVDLISGLGATGRNGDWKLSIDFGYMTTYNLKNPTNLFYLYSASLLNDQGRVIGSHGFRFNWLIDRNHNLRSNVIIRGRLDDNFYGVFDAGNGSNYWRFTRSYWLEGYFEIRIDDVTDIMQIKIDSIYEFDIGNAPAPPYRGGDTKIELRRQGPDIIPVRTETLRATDQSIIPPYTY